MESSLLRRNLTLYLQAGNGHAARVVGMLTSDLCQQASLDATRKAS